MPELAERPIQEEEKISAEHQKLPEVENLKPSTDELERTAEAIEGEDPRLSRYRQAMVEAREDIKSISESDNLKSLLEQALNEYVKSIHDMQNDQNNPFEAEIVKVKSRLDELDKGLMGNRGGEESLNNLYAAHVSLKKREISDEKANLTRRLFHLVDESRALYEERREEAHNYLAGLIFEACEKAGTFHVIDNAKRLREDIHIFWIQCRGEAARNVNSVR